MKTNEVLKLVDAGFTKEEILRMEAAESLIIDQEPQPDPVPAEPEPEQPAAEEPAAPEQLQPGQVFENAMEQLRKEFDDQIKRIQKANIQAADMPADKPQTAEDIIGKILKDNSVRLGERKREE